MPPSVIFSYLPRFAYKRGQEIKLSTCKTCCVIYVLKCPCGMLYVGKTIRPVNVRIKGHFRWKVLETVPKPTRGGDHHTILLQREARWIRRLDSTDPKGLNEQYNLSCFL
ncbi:hypothetical protein XELAEV_18028667mg [Xenopus laevis]|uniref:GIY-YIG domain-containing protein n=1 Tax=Xenopus laevis TaxID=8355 RepID=A0A974CQ56_XENLA|nr:hypothetical protein XELAEV_18028667mg [Xenopus laevis]